VFENERLATRMNQCFERLESLLRQGFKALADQQGSKQPTADAQARASVAVGLIQGRVHRFARTGFKRLPTEHLDATVSQLLAAAG
jgi:TetR/AcrR family transcriptional regulator